LNGSNQKNTNFKWFREAESSKEWQKGFDEAHMEETQRKIKTKIKNMRTKTVEYGTTHDVEVLKASKNLITVVDENNEGYLLANHGVEDLPKEGDKGKITFTEHNGSTKGYWKFTPGQGK
jgi:hypothetical protein